MVVVKDILRGFLGDAFMQQSANIYERICPTTE